MAQSSARCSPCQNLHNGKDELAGGNSTKGSNHHIPVPATTHALTPAVALFVPPLDFSGSADLSMVVYLEDDLQRILRTVWDSRASAPVSAPVVAATSYYEGPREQPPKTWFPDIYRNKTHLEYYNFF